MGEKQMTLEELVGWLDDNDVSYEIDDAGRLTVKGNLKKRFRDWVRTRRCTSLPDELVRVDGNLWLEQTPIVSLGGLTSVGGWLDLWNTHIASLGNLTFVEWSLDLGGTPLTSLNDLPQVGGDFHLDQNQFRLLTREVLRKVKGEIRCPGQVENAWVTLSPDELEAIAAENERRERLHNTRGSDVDWDLYDR